MANTGPLKWFLSDITVKVKSSNVKLIAHVNLCLRKQSQLLLRAEILTLALLEKECRVAEMEPNSFPLGNVNT